ncbi:MAG: YdiU family protein [Natronospirillum sp.]
MSVDPSVPISVQFNNTYAQLPEHFYARANPVRVPTPALIVLNRALLAELNMQTEADDAVLAEVFSGNRLLPGAEPLAQAYAGHQFGQFVPQLGDGRAVLLGEVVDQQGLQRDIQLKGAGRTPFSRGGDGRAPIGPVLREYVVSEAMHALNVPTTRALAAVTTGEALFRDASVPGAILTRIARSHVRIGTFQYFAARGDKDAIQTLVEHSLARLYPTDWAHYQAASPSNQSKASMVLLAAVAERQAALVAQWQALGFVHGVMNTDNMSISGETIDYGPCAFMETYQPNASFSAIDRDGRYAYDQQARIAQWNLARLAEALLAGEDDAQAVLPHAEDIVGRFAAQHAEQWRLALGRKLGLSVVSADDEPLIQDFLNQLHTSKVDFTQGFSSLSTLLNEGAESGFLTDHWLAQWHARLAADENTREQQRSVLQRHNPRVIPRNHLVERVIRAAEDDGNFAPFHALLAAVQRPFEVPDDETWELPAQPQEQVWRTFCGT